MKRKTVKTITVALTREELSRFKVLKCQLAEHELNAEAARRIFDFAAGILHIGKTTRAAAQAAKAAPEKS
jgi:hypothetical protein